jgi:transcriptional regulator with XRE-family HTH domain
MNRTNSEYEYFLNILLGIEFKRQRLFRSLSMEELCSKNQLDEKELEEFEQGSAPISATSLYSLCNALDIPLDEFYKAALEEANFSPTGSC